MPLETLQLDDLNWGEMVVGIRRRIAAASAGEWTLHAPVDPGVTLLELFAYLLEQRLFWMDQVPDSLVRAALSLLGEQPRPTQAAATVMQFPEVDDVLVLPANSEITLDGSSPPQVFSTESEILLLPLQKQNQQREQLSLSINGLNRTADLEHGKILRLFPADGSAGEMKITFRLRQALPSEMENKSLSLLFELYDSGNPQPQWSPQFTDSDVDNGESSSECETEKKSTNGVEVPAPAAITWSYSGAGGTRHPFLANEVKDGTGGLRRSGVVMLPIKTDWEPESLDAGTHIYEFAIILTIDKSTFSAPPRLHRLIPNVVIATHRRETQEHLLRREWLPLPGNELALADLPEDKPRKDYPPIENTIKIQIRERDNGWHEWKPTSDLAFHGATNRVFVTNRALGKVSFGDGLTGRLPVLNDDGGGQFKVRYTVGGGTTGRLGANRRWTAQVNDKQIRAINVVQTAGGEEPETMAAFRERVVSKLRAPTRAVIADDYKQIALSVRGVAIKRAYAAIGFHPNFPCVPIPGAVTVFIVPDVSRPDVLDENFDETLVESAFVAAPVPDAGALSLVRNALDRARLAGTEVIVLPPYYREVKLSLVIESNAIERTSLSRRIKRSLYKFFDPLIGGDEGDGWPFGEPVRPSAILREAQRALGNDGTVVQIFVTFPGGPAPGHQIESITDGLFGDCSMLQKDSPAGELPGSTTSLGSKEEANFRNCNPGAVRAVVSAPEQTCSDVEIGAHRLVKLLPIELHFQRALESQGGLR